MEGRTVSMHPEDARSGGPTRPAVLGRGTHRVVKIGSPVGGCHFVKADGHRRMFEAEKLLDLVAGFMERGDCVHRGTIAFVQSRQAKGCSIDFAVLASGAGTNLQAILDHGVPGLRVVISDVPGARALERAVEAGISTMTVPHTGDRSLFTRKVCDAAAEHGAEALVLAGFMRVLGSEAIDRFPHRIINIHPSLLPSFPGVNAVARALAHGVTVTGVTVHFVDEEVDHGPIIAQRVVPVLPGDDERTLHARIQEVEHDLFPRVVSAFLKGEVEVEHGRVVWL